MDKVSAKMLGGLVAVLILGFLALAIVGRPTETYVLFVSGPLVSAAFGALMLKRVAAVKHVADQVQEATNGLMGARFTHVDDQLEVATHDRASIAFDLAEDRARDGKLNGLDSSGGPAV